MKFNPVMSIIGVAIAALLGFLAYSLAGADANAPLCGAVSGVCFLAALLPLMGFTCDSSRLKANINVFSVISLVVFGVSHFGFAVFGVAMPYYLIINGLILLVYLAVLYKLQGIKEL